MWRSLNRQNFTFTFTCYEYYESVILFLMYRLALDGGVPVKKEFCLIILGICAMLGCSAKARLYPVQGPLSAQTPLPVLVGKVTGGPINPKNISVVLSDGEVCKGRWAMVHPVKVPKGANTATAPATNGMQAVWDTVYGPGYYVSHVLGTKYYAQSVASGDKGTVLNVEMYMPEAGSGGIKGVAKDNRDNLYKLVLQ
jgi:hypothetical protein